MVKQPNIKVKCTEVVEGKRPIQLVEIIYRETKTYYMDMCSCINLTYAFKSHLQQDPAYMDQLSKNITRQGLTNYTLNFLRVSWIQMGNV